MKKRTPRRASKSWWFGEEAGLVSGEQTLRFEAVQSPMGFIGTVVRGGTLGWKDHGPGDIAAFECSLAGLSLWEALFCTWRTRLPWEGHRVHWP